MSAKDWWIVITAAMWCSVGLRAVGSRDVPLGGRVFIVTMAIGLSGLAVLWWS